MKIPESTSSISSLIDNYHRSKAEHPRPHLGCSLLGHPCDRYLWLSFRWAILPNFSGRILRLFRRGQNEEEVIVADLKAIGLNVQCTGKNQTRVDFGCHVSGSLDAIIKSGVPEAPKKIHIAEFKTHNKKSFDDIYKNGVEKAKYLHSIQMQAYMHGTKIDRALYLAVCKDDDRIYTERVRYDAQIAEKAIKRGQRIVLSDRMPEKLSTDPSWYQCKMCHCYDFCHFTKLTREVNCRTCAHSTAKENSTWCCERYKSDGIPVDFQHKGCESHVIHPDLTPWLRKEYPSEWIAIYEIDGVDVANGEPCESVYSSKELIANLNACASNDPP